MWVSETAELEPIKAAELALLSSPVRGDAVQLARLIAPDFAEIGRSGRRFTFSEIVDSLQNEDHRASPRTSDWLFNTIGTGMVLVQYRVHSDEGESRHTSLWEIDGPVLRFHQGTPVRST